MRVLKYDSPRPVKNTSIHEGKSLQCPDINHYNRFSTVETAFGLVTVIDFKWQHNNGFYIWTEFATIINGIKYSAVINEGKLSDRQIKWLSTHFIKNIKK